MLNITIIREMQIKTTVRYHLTPVNNGYYQKDSKQQVLVRMWRKGTLMHCWWDCKLLQPLWKTVWRFLKKPKRELPYDTAIPLLGIYLKKNKTLIQTDICILLQHYLQKPRYGSNLSVQRCMNKDAVCIYKHIYIYNVIYIIHNIYILLLSHKKESCHLWQHGWTWRISW